MAEPLEPQQLEAAVAALQAQRALLGDAVVEATVAALRARLAAAAELPEPAQTLRQVSILFMDVVGSTTLAQQHDPETVSAVMDDALARGTALVLAQGGKVLQYAGDNILAAFGAEGAREDDAERAVHCGLALLALGRDLGQEVQAAHGHAGFDVRVGIHTGGVLLGGGVDAEGSIRGSAVNIAARMEQTAPAGALRISHDTYSLVRGLFEVQTQPPLQVKGVEVPIQSYLVRGAKPRNFRIGARGIEGVATRMIGRDADLQVLQAAFLRLFAQGSMAAVTVVADAGIGKSRLLYEFEAWSETRPEAFLLFRGRATPQTAAQAFGLLREIMAWRLQIHDDDSVETARRKLEEGIAPLFLHDDGPDLAQGHAHLLGHLIGIQWSDSRHIQGILDDPRQIRNRALNAAAQYFRRLSAREGLPLILQIEDLHWADDESLDFLSHLVEASHVMPMLVLGFTRPTLFERREGWLGTVAAHQRIELQPLDKHTSRELARELLQRLPEIPGALTELLTGSAEGNPFYMEELVKMLIDQGAIRTGEGWSVDGARLLVTRVPTTLTGVLQARLDGLPLAEKRAMQQASVVGAVFWDQVLAAMDVDAAAQLPALARRELTLPRADAPLDGLREYAFRHQILHQVTYETVLRRDKREGHTRVAQWLASWTRRGGLRAGDFLGLAAEHFERAGDMAQAAAFHALAADHACQRFAHQRVLAHVGRALELLGEPAAAQAELRWSLLTTRERSLSLLARRGEQAADLDALAHWAEVLGDDSRRADAALRRSTRAMRMADWAAMEAAAQEGMAHAARAGDHSQRLNAMRLQASALIGQGDVERGSAIARQGLEQARQLGLRAVEGRLLNALSVAAGMQDDVVGSLELDRQSLQILSESGDRASEAIVRMNLGAGWTHLGHMANGQREMEAALQLMRANGDRVAEGVALGNLSALALWQGDAHRALALAQSALDLAVATQARDMETHAAIALGHALSAQGQREAAREAYGRAQTCARAIDHPLQHDASAGIARLALAAGDTAAALAALEPVLTGAAARGSLEGTSGARLIELTCHQALARAGDARATEWLHRAHTALMTQAATIADPALRQGFLQAVPVHREIVATFEGRATGPCTPHPDAA